MTDPTHVPIDTDADIVAARQRGREIAVALGFTASDGTLIATAISEIARNILLYAKCGEIVLATAAEAGRRGIVIVARDRGPGIPDIRRALQDGYSTSQGLGLGLPGSRRLMDDFAITSEVGVGTTVTMMKWVRHGEPR